MFDQVFNVSLPKKEMGGKWSGRVLEVGWHEQLVPPLERLCSVCRALDSWLQAHPHHVAVIHSRYLGRSRQSCGPQSAAHWGHCCPAANAISWPC